MKVNGERTLTEKQRKFFEYIGVGYSPSDAAKAAGYKNPYTSARDVVEYRTQAFREIFAAKGYQMTDIADDLLKGKEAVKVIGFLHNFKKDKDGKPVKAEPDEKISNEFVEAPDYNARHKFIDSIIKLQDYYPKTKLEHSGEIVQKVDYSKEDLLKLLDEIQKERESLAVRNEARPEVK